ncbi:MAG: hypothetical protein ACOVOQ_03325 [Flavobacterium sp.]
MSNLKNVGNKLFKTELANHKVELNLVQELWDTLNASEDGYKKFINSYQKIDEFKTKFDELKKSVALDGQNYINDATKLKKLYDNRKKMAEDLGLDFDESNLAKRIKVMITNNDPKVVKGIIEDLK